MPELTLKEKILEAFDKYIATFNEPVNKEYEIKVFIAKALDRQREEFMKCLPKEIINDNDIRLGNSRPHNERLIGKKLFNSCRNRFLENLKKDNLI